MTSLRCPDRHITVERHQAGRREGEQHTRSRSSGPGVHRCSSTACAGMLVRRATPTDQAEVQRLAVARLPTVHAAARTSTTWWWLQEIGETSTPVAPNRDDDGDRAEEGRLC